MSNKKSENPPESVKQVCLEQVLAARTHAKTKCNHDLRHRGLRRTPLWRANALSSLVHFKCEHLQHSGSFKARGALNWLVSLPRTISSVAASCSINHATALAWASSQLGIHHKLFLKDPVPTHMTHILDSLNANWTSSSTPEEDCLAFASTPDITVYQPVNHPDVHAGYGTLALEILEDLEWFDELWIPTGDGDLLQAMAVVMRALRPTLKLVACIPPEHSGFPFPEHKTLSDQIKTLSHVHERSCTLTSLKKAQHHLATHEKQLVETFGCVTLGCLLEHPELSAEKRIVLILTGGNIDPEIGVPPL